LNLEFYIWDHYISKKNLNKKVSNIINDKDFNINNILKDWAHFVEFKNYSLCSLPENLKIKLRLPENFIESEKVIEYDSDTIYDKYNKYLDI
jgi:hypothetical protein